MARESQRGVGRDAAGPHGYTVKLEHYLAQKGEEGATLDELVDVAVRESWISHGFAHRMYAARLTASREREHRINNKSGNVVKATPEGVAMRGEYPEAVRFLLQRSLNAAARSGGWASSQGPRGAKRYFSTGKGLVRKPQGGWTVEELTQTPEQIGGDVAMREVIRMLKPYKDQKTHKVSQAEWTAIRHWLNLVAVTWDNQK